MPLKIKIPKKRLQVNDNGIDIALLGTSFFRGLSSPQKVKAHQGKGSWDQRIAGCIYMVWGKGGACRHVDEDLGLCSMAAPKTLL